MERKKNENYIDKADESRGEIYDLCYYYFKDDCQPVNLVEELRNKYGINTTLPTVKHCYKCGWYKRHIIEYYTHTTSGERHNLSINDYFAKKGIYAEDI